LTPSTDALFPDDAKPVTSVRTSIVTVPPPLPPLLAAVLLAGVVPSDNPPYLLDPDGWFLQGTPDDWRRLESSTIEVLVRSVAFGVQEPFAEADDMVMFTRLLERLLSDCGD
jgi:hypothetical protein